MKNSFCFFILFLVVLGCKEKPQPAKNKTVTKTTQFKLATRHNEYVTLDTLVAKKMTNWKEYTILNNFIAQYKYISPNQALNNAIELKNLIKNAKDSIRPKILQTPAFKARIDVLENEGLRLVDMTYIPAITADEVNNEVSKILKVYSSVNKKINTVFSQKELENSVGVNGDFFGIDTTTTEIKPKKLLHEKKSIIRKK
ncbi:hypothetical protein [Tenacibaculum sp. UWU-22]|uniref:hypothetical protein n=1 Tax=Tenacibaculum sp. UWU-22 TaxID=3234187 RepID=UPI0034DAD7D4